jgi:hypothetical protein
MPLQKSLILQTSPTFFTVFFCCALPIFGAKSESSLPSCLNLVAATHLGKTVCWISLSVPDAVIALVIGVAAFALYSWSFGGFATDLISVFVDKAARKKIVAILESPSIRCNALSVGC